MRRSDGKSRSLAELDAMNDRVRLAEGRIRVGDRLAISFQRTLRIPDDGRAYPLPPGLGLFPLRRASDFGDALPNAWHDDFLVPIYRREALWIGFDGAWWKPNVVKVGVGGVDALTGRAFDDVLRDDPQNYVVVPDQPWIDGINAGADTVRQFVAMPLGEQYSVEAQITGSERTGGIQLVAFEPKPGRFPDEPPPQPDAGRGMVFAAAMPAEMGIGAGGTMRQKIYADEYGLQSWEERPAASLFVRLIAAAEWRAITGDDPPPSPVDARAYTKAGLPWFALYDEDAAGIAASQALARIKSIRELEQREAEEGISVSKTRTHRLRRKP
jgi:hypothetical protein